MKKLLFLLTISVFLFSCEQSNEELITKKWQAVDLENPSMDETIRKQQQFLDTFGKNTTPAENEKIYGFRNVDSMRQSLATELKDYKSMQQHAVQNTWFDFRKDGVAVLNFSGQLDSTNWYFDDEGALILDEMKLKGTGNKIVMQVVQLTDTSLKLKFTEDGLTSTVTFHPSEK